MAADLHYPPTSFLAEDNKTPVGYNVEIAQLLGKKMGLKVKIKNVSFDSVIPGIAAGRYDFTATNMTPTADRLEGAGHDQVLGRRLFAGVQQGQPAEAQHD